MIADWLLRTLFASASIGTQGKADCDVVIANPNFVWKLLARGGSLALGEAHMRGDFDAKHLEQVLEKLGASWLAKIPSPQEFAYWLAGLVQDPQSRDRSREVALRHYDIPPGIYEPMLGSTMVYTSALGMTEGKSLDEAQVAKIERLLDQIVTFRPGDVVLDIGCGWGAAMGEVARRGGRAVGVTISEGQLAWAKQKYAGANNLDFRLMDYRDFNETVDHVVSVEMIEAVGRRHLREYFEKAFSVIRKDDRPRYFVLQAIVANNPRGTGRDAFLGKYIFPGGELPLLSQLREAAEGLFHLVEEHQFGLGYAHTLQAWKRNLQANAAAVIAEFAKTADWADKPEQAYRMMLFYLDLCTAGFRLNLTSVGQFTFCTQPAPAPR